MNSTFTPASRSETWGRLISIRGYVMTSLAEMGYGRVVQTLLSGLVFGLVHFYGFGGLSAALVAQGRTFLLGIALAITYLVGKRSLTPVIIGHALTDLIIEPWLLLSVFHLFIVHPVEHTPLNEFLAIFERGNVALWPMQLVWYASAAAMVGLALWPRRRASQLICLLAAAYFAWVGIVFFGVIDSGMTICAATFILEAVLLLVAGIGRRELVSVQTKQGGR